jgi:Phosphate-selective porin O and P
MTSCPSHARRPGRPLLLAAFILTTAGIARAQVGPAEAAQQTAAIPPAAPAALPVVTAAPGPVAAPQPAAPAPEPEKKPEPHWYEKLKIRGYTQFRYNRIPTFNDNDKLVNAQGDRSIGGGNGLSIRRARLIIQGDVHERVFVYLQTDFASVIDEQLHVAIVRDWYADLHLDKAKEFRIRLGQSKVPFGFENLQSSQNRLPFDRSDALNSAVKDERDMGAYLYWAPSEIRGRFKHLVDGGLKGSGDYGVLGVGVFNGQTANRPALEDDVHVVGRVTWPFLFGEQFVELGGGGYYGKYRVSVDQTAGYSAPRGRVEDARGFLTAVVYPQPFGFQAEVNYGTGPSLGKGDDDQVVKARELFGAYAQLMYKVDGLWGTVSLIPYARATYYDGGKKFEKNAPHYLVKELELGAEWQLIKNLEVVLAYDLAERTSSRAPYVMQRGHVGRLQVQVNY